MSERDVWLKTHCGQCAKLRNPDGTPRCYCTVRGPFDLLGRFRQPLGWYMLIGPPRENIE